MKRWSAAFALCVSLVSLPVVADEHPATEGVAPAAARQMLEEGNNRYTSSAVRPRRYKSERPALSKGQHPYAMVLSCADSRVPPEIVFDESLGKLFVVRVAGNVASPDELASLEYATEHLGARYLVVLGHTSCGAVKAAMDKDDPTPNLGTLLKEIRPAIDTAKAKGGDPAAVQSGAEKANVQLQMQNVAAKSEVLKKAIADGKIGLAGGVYDLKTGKVEWLAP
jgi:carbonic anhydrase